MHNYKLIVLLNFSVLVPAVIGMIRFRSIIKSFYPFIIMICFGSVNEALSLSMIFGYGSNLVNSNIYVLVEFAIILFQFFKWNGVAPGKYLVVGGIGLITWIADNFFINSITGNNSLFRIVYSFIIVFYSIDQVNKILIYEKGRLLKNAMFLICITFLLYYGCKAFVETFNVFRLELSKMFWWNLWVILYFVNFISNLLYALAILCIPTKQEFTLPY